MKSYTNIEQSKKLTQILPVESADMRFCFSHTLGGRTTGHYPMIGREPSLGTIPCWSLEALLEGLPKGTNVSTPKPLNELSYCCWNQQEEIFADNPVDACYDMIIHLHELKML